MVTSHPSSQSGNILVYILGAILLMGLLVVVVKGVSNPGSGIDQEAVIIRVSDVQRYAGEVERGVNMILRSGQSEADLRFSHPNGYSAYGIVHTAPFAREVFHAAGGAAEYRMPPPGVNDGTRWQFFSNTHITGMGTEGAGLRRAELLMVLPNVTQAFCERVNLVNGQNLNVVSQVQDPAANGCIYSPGSEFNGTYSSGAGANSLDSALITHKPAAQACVRCSSGALHFYHVLLAR